MSCPPGLGHLAILVAAQEFPKRAHASQNQNKEHQQFRLILEEAMKNVPIDGTTGKHI
jgi:hypothetical protein